MTPRSPLFRRTVFGATFLLALGTGAATASAAAVGGGDPIGPNQYFNGYVNNQTGSSTIKVVCSADGTTGHPADGQTVEALPGSASAADNGYTGNTGDSLTVQVTPGAKGGSSLIGTLTDYAAQLTIPNNLTVPCSGTGVVSFAPTPTGAGAVTATVKVAFAGSVGIGAPAGPLRP